MIEILNLNKAFENVQAVKGLDLTIAGGELFGFLGPNGAGMTALMSTHTLEIAQEICHRIGIINRGTLIQSGTIESLQKAARHDGNLEEVFLKIVSEERE